jgi:hypothetical protein
MMLGIGQIERSEWFEKLSGLRLRPTKSIMGGLWFGMGITRCMA